MEEVWLADYSVYLGDMSYLPKFNLQYAAST